MKLHLDLLCLQGRQCVLPGKGLNTHYLKFYPQKKLNQK